MPLVAKELDSSTYPAFEQLAAKQGGCWCMYYQRPRPIDGGMSRDELKRINRRDKQRLIEQDRAHAILVFDDDKPIGWCQYGPGEELPRIDAGRGYRSVGPPKGKEKLWRITCFFVERQSRSKGVAKFALNAAIKSIKRQGGGIIEAYPVVSKKMAAVPEWRWFGTPSMFKREGFKVVAPLGTSSVLMRRRIARRY